MRIEPQPASRVEQPTAQRALKQFEPLCRLTNRDFGGAAAQHRPAGLDLPDPFDHERVIGAVRPAVEWQAHFHRPGIACGQQKAIAPKIVKAEPFPADRLKQWTKAADAEQLSGQQMVALQAGVKLGPIGAVHRAKRQRRRIFGCTGEADPCLGGA